MAPTNLLLAAAPALVAALIVPSPAAAEDTCGDLLVVLDRSMSMGQCTIGGISKRDLARAAIRSVIAKFPAVPMGLFVFPGIEPMDLDGPGCWLGGDWCLPGQLIEPVAAAGGTKIAEWIDKTMAFPRDCGGTPTGVSMQKVRDYDDWTPGKKHFVLLITDGQPTCQDGDDGGMPPKECNGGGSMQCKNPTKVFDAIKDLAAKGTHTFVVGFEGAGDLSCVSYGGGMPFDPETLNRMAEYGGEAQPAPAATRYHSATDAATLNDAMSKIIGKVVGGTVGGCASGGAKDGGAGDSGAGGAGGGGAGTDAHGSQDRPGSGGAGGGGENGGASHGSPGCACVLGRGPSEELLPRWAAPTLLIPLALILGALARRRRSR